MLKRIKNKNAFTLIELIITIAVLGVLVLLAAPRFGGHVQTAEMTKGFADAKSIQKASELYFMDNEDWPRLTDDPYTSEEIKAYSEHIYDTTGKEVNLDPNGNYYNIDYNKLKEYIKVPSNKEDYILQNPVGKVFYMDELTESGSNRVDYKANKQENLRMPSKPVVAEKTDSSYTVTGEAGTEVKLNDGEWKNSPHIFADLNDGETYTAYSRFKETENYSASKVSEGTKFEVEAALSGPATFTNAGSTGYTGPSQSELDNAYAGTILEGDITSANGIQLWTVPASGTYRIEAYGAQGGSSSDGNLKGGNGAVIVGDFNFGKGEIISILVGQAGGNTINRNTGGGGGTFVYKNPLSYNPLIAAGGGGGSLSHNTEYNKNVGPGINASATSVVLDRIGGSIDGRANIAGEGAGWGGAGWRSNSTAGTGAAGQAPYVYAPRNSGKGYSTGGFGGGHSTNWTSNAGAGGGYTGGIGAYNANGGRGSGGGSYNSGANQKNSVGNTGHGKVIINFVSK